jgi:hypothetical protein
MVDPKAAVVVALGVLVAAVLLVPNNPPVWDTTPGVTGADVGLNNEKVDVGAPVVVNALPAIGGCGADPKRDGCG